MRIYLTTILIAVFFISCKKVNLDGLAYPSTQLSAYEFEKYDAGKRAVPEEYAIEAANRTLVSMQSKDKATGEVYEIFGVYIGDISSIPNDSILLYCHGQSAHMDAYWSRASLLASLEEKHQYGVFMMDYRGYGMSEGKSSESGLSEDVDASIDWLISKGANASQTFYYGFSLGCIPVINRAAERTDFKPAKIILEAPLASVENLTNSSLILNVNPSFVSTLDFNNAEKIKEVDAPLLWFHGEEDDYIAIENGELIYTNYNGQYKEAVRVSEANHESIPSVMGYENYLSTLEAYIKK